MLVRLTVLKSGEAVLSRDLLERLGARPGDEVEADVVRPPRAGEDDHPISKVFGMFYDPSQPSMTIEDINEAAAAGWAGER